MKRKVVKTDSEWRQLLSAEQYRICRGGGTQPAFSGEYYNCKDAGIYRCVACASELFSSADKFDSGTGWPSFTRPVEQESIETRADYSLGLVRTEVLCAGCGSHLGHVFAEATASGQRYCINDLALDFEAL